MGSIPRMDEILGGVEWVLVRQPELNAIEPHSDLGVIYTNPVGNTPQYRIAYKFSDSVVEALSIELVRDHSSPLSE